MESNIEVGSGTSVLTHLEKNKTYFILYFARIALSLQRDCKI